MAAAARRWLEDASAIGEDVDGRRRCRDPRRCRWRRCRRFTPASPREWALRDGSVGCARRMRLNCTGDGFLPLRGVKLPDATNATADASISLDQCWQRFLMNCSCLAFSASSINRGESGCINTIVEEEQEDIAAEGVRRGGEAGGIDQAAAAPAAAAAGATRRRQGARCARCGEICEEYAKTFYLGTLLMMEERRHAIWAIYGQEQAWSQVYAHKGFFVLFELADLQPGVSAQ